MNNVTTLKTKPRGRGQNALKFGIFSKKNLPMNNDERKEIELLINDLNVQLNPQGTLEELQVQKIGWLWLKQQRLMRSEMSEIELSQLDRPILEEVRKLLCDNTVSQDDADSKLDEDVLNQCESVLKGENLDAETILSCVNTIKSFERKKMIKTVVELVKNKHSIPNDIEKLSLYQQRLDNQLYRATSELRNMQKYRIENMKVIEN